MSLDFTYNYKARVVRIIDGDSLILNCDLGFKTHIEIPVRLAHINAMELRDANEEKRARAKQAKDELAARLTNPLVTIRSLKPFKGDKYGRYLVEITNSEGVNVNQTLLDLGLAEPYEGGKR